MYLSLELYVILLLLWKEPIQSYYHRYALLRSYKVLMQARAMEHSQRGWITLAQLLLSTYRSDIMTSTSHGTAQRGQTGFKYRMPKFQLTFVLFGLAWRHWPAFSTWERNPEHTGREARFAQDYTCAITRLP